MSLIRLLTTGRSLVNIPDGDSRYRVTSQRLLPHFGARQNPFSCGDKAEPTPTAPCSPSEHTPKVEPPSAGVAPASVAGQETAPKSKREIQVALAKSRLRILVAVLWRWAAVFLDGCQAKLAALFARQRSKAAKPAIPRFNKPPVQTELLLDRIRVLRNDLRDADLEVVPVKAPTPPATPAQPAGEKPAVAETAWGRLTERIAGTGKH
jgi:hypothetical protein